MKVAGFLPALGSVLAFGATAPVRFLFWMYFTTVLADACLLSSHEEQASLEPGCPSSPASFQSRRISEFPTDPRSLLSCRSCSAASFLTWNGLSRWYGLTSRLAAHLLAKFLRLRLSLRARPRTLVWSPPCSLVASLRTKPLGTLRRRILDPLSRRIEDTLLHLRPLPSSLDSWSKTCFFLFGPFFFSIQSLLLRGSLVPKFLDFLFEFPWDFSSCNFCSQLQLTLQIAVLARLCGPQPESTSSALFHLGH